MVIEESDGGRKELDGGAIDGHRRLGACESVGSRLGLTGLDDTEKRSENFAGKTGILSVLVVSIETDGLCFIRQEHLGALGVRGTKCHDLPTLVTSRPPKGNRSHNLSVPQRKLLPRMARFSVVSPSAPSRATEGDTAGHSDAQRRARGS